MTTHPIPDAAPAAPEHLGLLAEADAALTAAADLRRAQLDGLPDAEGDPVVAVQRAALRQTLADIATARRRLADGTFGTCTRCGGPVPADRLELRPWADTCVRCGSR